MHVKEFESGHLDCVCPLKHNKTVPHTKRHTTKRAHTNITYEREYISGVPP